MYTKYWEVKLVQIPFYDDFLKIPLFTDGSDFERYKDDYIHKKIINNSIYKFIPFSEDEDFNNRKINLVAEKKLWVSCHSCFEDKNEVAISCNPKVIARKTGVSEKNVRYFINTTKEMNDVSCFTYGINDFMWKNYANGRNGFCLRFEVINTAMFYPVIYLNKERIDFTEDYIQDLRNMKKPTMEIRLSRPAILPWVLKDSLFFQENELRFLYGDAYDDENGDLGGRIAVGKKSMMGYKGTTCDYGYCGIALKEIIIGENCSDSHKKMLCSLLQ